MARHPLAKTRRIMNVGREPLGLACLDLSSD